MHLLMDHVQELKSLVAQMVKHLPAMRETRVRSLGREDSPGEGNGNSLQYSCLENSMDGEAWSGYSPWGLKESDTTEGLHFHFTCRREHG